ncbi:DUF5691 domain-containing protein [Rhizosphaericola mali]|uniref:Uncharacterized protein n=1 Tax=Rhizosphaericola mali TaxID=2545455 RepID=A0A5P2G249_9BACT|nr:DUF5691 domain-containing protein [Rhizosphaericola mali]QES89886.1 hypothetical protein E0W69_014880 [Rhizosphaericola mali]
MIEEEIVKTALLGTDRYQPNLQFDFSDIMQKIEAKAADKESRFLQQTATYFMVKAASIPLSDVAVEDLETHDSEKYISESTQKILQSALNEDNQVLLQYCFYLFQKRKEIITPYLVPDILEKYASANQRQEILPLCGFIGKEILKFRGEEIQATNSVESDVEVASFAQIKEWITQTRKNSPSSIWEKEEEKKQSAFEEILNNEKPDRRAELLELLQINLSKSDKTFLLPQLKTKSKTVKTVVIRLLMQIENSPVQEDFKTLLNELISIEIRKQLLGLKKTTAIVIQENHTLTAAQKAYGLDEISNVKGVSDGIYQLAQCIEVMPLSLVAQTINLPEADIIQQLYFDLNNNHLQLAFMENARTFHNNDLIRKIVGTGERLGLAAYLPFQEASDFYKKALKSSFGNNNRDNFYLLFNWLWNLEGYPQLDTELSMSILSQLKSNPYTIEGRNYYQLGLYLPKEIKPWLTQEINRPLGDNEGNFYQLHIQQTLKAIEDKALLNQ